ncbi:unnamed protein product, partial [Discosporangium mesarthrocarpum]
SNDCSSQPTRCLGRGQGQGQGGRGGGHGERGGKSLEHSHGEESRRGIDDSRRTQERKPQQPNRSTNSLAGSGCPGGSAGLPIGAEAEEQQVSGSFRRASLASSASRREVGGARADKAFG